MPATPVWRAQLVDAWLADTSAWQIHATTDPYDPALTGEDMYALTGDPIGLTGVALEPRPDGQAWVVYSGVTLSLTGVPAETDVAGLILTAAVVGSPDRVVVAYLAQRADTTPVAFTADGRDYEVTFPGGFLTRLV